MYMGVKSSKKISVKNSSFIPIKAIF